MRNPATTHTRTRTPATASAAGPVDGIRVEPARREDQDAYLTLLAAATPGEPLSAPVRQVLSQPAGPPFTHGHALCLIARDVRTQRPVGALLGSPPSWIGNHPLAVKNPDLAYELQSRVVGIHALAVAEDHRGQGIAPMLIHAAERRFRKADYKLVTGEHTPDLTGYYARLGYRSTQQLILLVPGLDLFGQRFTDHLMTAKPLDKRVELVDVPSAPGPIVSGLFPGYRVPRGASFDGRRLTA